MIEPARRDEALLDDIRASSKQDEDLRIWWLGQSGFLVQHRAAGEVGHVLIDPYLSDSLTLKYAATDKPHVRMTRLVVSPRRLDFIDLVTSSHNHTDHLDGETLGPLLEVNPGLVLVAPEANRDFVCERLGIPRERPLGLDAGLSTTIGAVEITAIASAHEELERDDADRHRFLGYVFRFGQRRIYHSGDTVLWDGLAEALRPHAVDVAMLPINGRAPERRVAGNLNGAEAAQLGRDIGARTVIPCHYEMFEFNTASPEAFVAVCERLGQGYRVLRCGESWSP